MTVSRVVSLPNANLPALLRPPGVTVRATVEIRRSNTLPTGTDATYSQDGAAVVIEMRADLITARGARLLSQMCEDALLESWKPKTPLQLIKGGLLQMRANDEGQVHG